jgi:hypothetical protein
VRLNVLSPSASGRLRAGGSNDPANGVPLYSRCHAKIGSQGARRQRVGTARLRSNVHGGMLTFRPMRRTGFLLALTALGATAAMALGSCGGGSTTTVATTAALRMPDVTGKQQSDAETTLRDAGFKTSYLAVPNNAQPGTVLAQSPAAGSPVAKGSKATLTISATPRPGTKPAATHGTVCGPVVHFTGSPRRAQGITAQRVSCSAALVEVNVAHRLLNSCPKGEHCDVGDYSCTQRYYGGPTLAVRCVSGRGTARWEWAGY